MNRTVIKLSSLLLIGVIILLTAVIFVCELVIISISYKREELEFGLGSDDDSVSARLPIKICGLKLVIRTSR